MLKRLLPKLQVSSVYDIDLEALSKQGIKGIITDLDNTLVGARVPEAPAKLVEWLKEVQERGFAVVIVSNNTAARVGKFAEPLHIPFIYSARKPINRPFKRALEQLGLRAEQTAVLGDQMLTDVLGGNRMGLYTVLVTPVDPAQEGVTTRFNRRIEDWALARLRKRGLWQEGDWYK